MESVDLISQRGRGAARQTQIWPAPAKLNLFLHVVGRRRDGYHSLQTVFQFLDHGDELSFTVTSNSDIVRTTSLPEIAPETDLCLKAARLLQSTVGIGQGAKIHVIKRIPVGAGLGGGSSDAATTLIALNRLWSARLTIDRLAELGLQLGADVPVFVRGRAAWAEGVGETLSPLDLEEPWYVVVVPPVKVSTADVFKEFSEFAAHADSVVQSMDDGQRSSYGSVKSPKNSARASDPQLTPYSPAITIRAFREGCATRNDLEAVVRRRYPEVDRLMRWLSGYGAARMTGSGGGAFLNVDDAARGREILAQAPSGYHGFVARGQNTHPLRAD